MNTVPAPPPATALALVSCPADHAETLATHLVSAGHAACVNIVPQIRSIYRWQGQIRRDEESLLLIKHARDQFATLRDLVLALHPYELPEIVAIDLDRGHAPYLAWLAAASSPLPP